MSLKRHLTEVVRPWLSANCHWALSDRRLLLGTPEDIADQQAQGSFIQVLESVLGGMWDPPAHPWEIRREAMLDMLGKAKPYAMTAALQIDKENARLLIEALSGRATYEKERRDQRTVWDHVMNAFGLAVDRIAPGAAPLGPPPTVKTWFDPLR